CRRPAAPTRWTRPSARPATVQTSSPSLTCASASMSPGRETDIGHPPDCNARLPEQARLEVDRDRPRPHQMEQRRRDPHPIPDQANSIDNAARIAKLLAEPLREHRIEVARVPVAGQPGQVRNEHVVDLADPAIRPADLGASRRGEVELLLVAGLDPVIGTDVDDLGGAVEAAREEVRDVAATLPDQPKRLR